MSPIRVAAWAFTDAGTGPAASMARVGGKPTQAPLARCMPVAASSWAA